MIEHLALLIFKPEMLSKTNSKVNNVYEGIFPTRAKKSCHQTMEDAGDTNRIPSIVYATINPKSPLGTKPFFESTFSKKSQST